MNRTVDDYIAAQRSEIRPILSEVREVIRAEIPDAEECISWQMPTYKRKRNLIHFAAQKNHLGIYPGPEAVEHFAPILDEQGFRYSKGAVQFPYDHVPLPLIRRIAAFCGKPEGHQP